MVGLAQYISNNKADLALRAWNGLVAGAVSYQLINDPYASAMEYLPDIILHSVECLIPHTVNSELMTICNALRGTQALAAFVTGNAYSINITPSTWQIGLIGFLPAFSLTSTPSTIPAIANGADIINHGMNIAKRLSNLMSANSSTQPVDVMDKRPKLVVSRKGSSHSNTDQTQQRRSPRLHPSPMF